MTETQEKDRPRELKFFILGSPLIFHGQGYSRACFLGEKLRPAATAVMSPIFCSDSPLKIRLMDVPEMGTETSEDSLSGSGFDFLPGELVQPDLVLTPHPDFGSKNNGPTPSTGARACNSSNEDKVGTR
eukprot:TCALIF_01015-PA protein Name:"Protein of unknown function" AED:0.45 eAED:0.45 QI:0/0/0/0.5/0/0.5/2/0/128